MKSNHNTLFNLDPKKVLMDVKIITCLENNRVIERNWQVTRSVYIFRYILFKIMYIYNSYWRMHTRVLIPVFATVYVLIYIIIAF